MPQDALLGEVRAITSDFGGIASVIVGDWQRVQQTLSPPREHYPQD